MKIVEKLMTYDLIITDSHVMTPNGMVEKNIVIDSGKIKLITNDTPSCDKCQESSFRSIKCYRFS